jgi:hypothetical protein
MPAVPGDWYLVVPLPETPGSDMLGSAVVYVVAAADSDQAAQIVFDQGFPAAAVIVAEKHEAP